MPERWPDTKPLHELFLTLRQQDVLRPSAPRPSGRRAPRSKGSRTAPQRARLTGRPGAPRPSYKPAPTIAFNSSAPIGIRSTVSTLSTCGT
jgi:hypothetical protein